MPASTRSQAVMIRGVLTHVVEVLPERPIIEEQGPEIVEVSGPFRRHRLTDRMLDLRTRRDDEIARQPRADEDHQRRHEVVGSSQPLFAEDEESEKRGFEGSRTEIPWECARLFNTTMSNASAPRHPSRVSPPPIGPYHPSPERIVDRWIALPRRRIAQLFALPQSEAKNERGHQSRRVHRQRDRPTEPDEIVRRVSASRPGRLGLLRLRAEGSRRVALGSVRPGELALARQLLDPLFLVVRARERREKRHDVVDVVL